MPKTCPVTRASSRTPVRALDELLSVELTTVCVRDSRQITHCNAGDTGRAAAGVAVCCMWILTVVQRNISCRFGCTIIITRSTKLSPHTTFGWIHRLKVCNIGHEGRSHLLQTLLETQATTCRLEDSTQDFIQSPWSTSVRTAITWLIQLFESVRTQSNQEAQITTAQKSKPASNRRSQPVQKSKAGKPKEPETSEESFRILCRCKPCDMALWYHHDMKLPDILIVRSRVSRKLQDIIAARWHLLQSDKASDSKRSNHLVINWESL